jgi:hypothetical protein
MTVTGRDWSKETGLEPHVFSVVSAEAGNLEQQLAQAIGRRASVLAIANRSSVLETASLVPRLFLPDEGWEEIAEALVGTAHIIVVWVEAMTPGIRWELECIRRNGRTSSTVVVLGADDDDWRATRKVIRTAAAVDSPAAATTPKAAELRGFELIVDARDVSVAGGALAPALADLVHDMEVNANLDPEQRVRHLAGL